jgi:hypothetical protein
MEDEVDFETNDETASEANYSRYEEAKVEAKEETK